MIKKPASEAADDAKGGNLIFLISQPRAGSTLLQRVLAGHSAVHTLGEPWLMLHPLFALHGKKLKAPYNAEWNTAIFRQFLRSLPGGEKDYYVAVRRMAGHLYQQALSGTGKTRFLDKTPRYYHVVPELGQVFPAARTVLLFRNPLAVLVSILHTWVQNDWTRLVQYRDDLLHAPSLLLQATRVLGEQAVRIHYEEFVRQPESVLKEVSGHLQLEYDPALINYGDRVTAKWNVGDPDSVYRQQRPSPDGLERWKQALDDPQVWRLCGDYLRFLGPELIHRMGYSHDKLKTVVRQYRPGPLKRRTTLPLRLLLKRRSRHRPWQRWLVARKSP